jgi:hypothetical protein
MARPSQRQGVSGANNAMHQAFRLCGGSFNSPVYHQPEMKLTRSVQPSDFRQTATYATGVQGGILAKLVMKVPLSEDEKQLIAMAA